MKFGVDEELIMGIMKTSITQIWIGMSLASFCQSRAVFFPACSA